MTVNDLKDYFTSLADHGKGNIPVVRCKNCDHWVKSDDGIGRNIGRTDGACLYLANYHHAGRYLNEGDHFCAYGERRTDD